jgi:hypothetical protein
MSLTAKTISFLTNRTTVRRAKPMVILPSLFTQRRLQQIQATNDKLNTLIEEIAVTKAKRAAIEAILPALNHCWKSVYIEIENLWIEQLRLEAEHKRVWSEVSACLGEYVPVTTSWRVHEED